MTVNHTRRAAKRGRRDLLKTTRGTDEATQTLTLGGHGCLSESNSPTAQPAEGAPNEGRARSRLLEVRGGKMGWAPNIVLLSAQAPPDEVSLMMREAARALGLKGGAA